MMKFVDEDEQSVTWFIHTTHQAHACLCLIKAASSNGCESQNIQLTPKVKMVKPAFILVINVSSENGMHSIMGLGPLGPMPHPSSLLCFCS
jgi:hypothetical protein